MPADNSGGRVPPDGHPDRLRWNARYGAGFAPSFRTHPLAVRALAMDLPDGPVADLACGTSGSALLAAARGRAVTAVDISEAADTVAPGGLLGWEAFTAEARQARPDLSSDWCLAPGEPESLLPTEFTVLDEHGLPERGRRQLLARRQ